MMMVNVRSWKAPVGGQRPSSSFFLQVRLVQHSPVTSDSDAKRDMKKSAVRGYASEILLLVVRSSGDVTYLKKFSQILLNIGSQDEASRFVPPKS